MNTLTPEEAETDQATKTPTLEVILAAVSGALEEELLDGDTFFATEVSENYDEEDSQLGDIFITLDRIIGDTQAIKTALVKLTPPLPIDEAVAKLASKWYGEGEDLREAAEDLTNTLAVWLQDLIDQHEKPADIAEAIRKHALNLLVLADQLVVLGKR